MTYVRRPGEIIEQTINNVESPIGKGILHVTSIGLVLTINGDIRMDLNHEVITSVINTDRNKVVVSWIENEKDGFDFEFRIDNAKEFAKTVTEKYNYSANFTNDVSLKIPASIPGNKRWNDCYYDKSRKAYITFNKRFEQVENVRSRDIQIKFDKEMGNKSGIIIDESKIKYKIPAMISENQNGKPVWQLLPTMTDEMLTDEIVTNRLQAKSDDEAVIYQTVSEAWISVGTKGLMLTERENEIGEKIGHFIGDVSLEQLKIIHNRK